MTDLTTLLDEAAGAEPALTEADLIADLARAKRSLRRRRVAGVAISATATAAVVGVAFSLAAPDPSKGSPVVGETNQAVTKTCAQLRTEYGLKVTLHRPSSHSSQIEFRLPGSGEATVVMAIGPSVGTTEPMKFADNGEVTVRPPDARGWSTADWNQVTRNCIGHGTAPSRVKLVASGKAPAGAKVWCDLKPAGWTPVVLAPALGKDRLGFRPPAGGEMFEVRVDSIGKADLPSPPGLDWTAESARRFNDSCHLV
jgi:hypothetical protein